MGTPTLEGITPKTVTTNRIATRVLFSGPEDGIPVLFLHGNVSSATWWEKTLVTLPDGYHGIAPDQRGFGEADHDAKVDATRGMGDFADDALALLDYLGFDKVHIVGNSLGGMVVWRLLMIGSERLLTVTLVDPGSPYGFGATRDVEGTPTNPDFAGSGGGLSNPELIRLMKEGEMSADNQFSPRAALRTLLVKPPFIPKREDELVLAMLSTHLGKQAIPGDSTKSIHWPHMAPGVWGATNATSPKYVGNVSKLINCDPKPEILWIRGSHDMVVSDTAASDPGFLGKMNFLPGWPGEEEYPPQPMIGQNRAVLEKYTAAGGSYKEEVIENAGHVPFIEKPEEFNRVFHKHIMES